MNSSHTRLPLWNVPYQQNPFFTGREDILHQLDQALHADSAVALSHPQGISGLGGIGKTQTALEYAYRYGGNYDAVFWVQAGSAAALTSGYATLARLLSLPERDEQDQRVMVEAVLRWLRVHSGWLLVFDGMDELSVAEPFLPKAGQGHLLFTTRAHALGKIAQRVEVQQMEPETGALLLLRRASLLAFQNPLSRANPDDQILACAISRELDGLPLALDQAGAYIKEAPCLLSDYLDRYRTRRRDLLGVRGSSTQDYPASVATTWSLSFEKVRQANPAAAELLNFCAYLSPEAIPEEILTAGTSHLGEILAPVVINPLQLDLACKEVLRFSLFQREADTHSLTIHRLVQAVLRDNLPAETQQRWMRSAVHAVNAAYPGSDFAHWPVLERLLPHALTCATWIEQAPLAMLEASNLLNWAGYYLHNRSRHAEAEPLYLRALSISERQSGPDHPDTVTSLNNLALLYQDQGQYTKAESLYLRALSIREHRLGPNHPDTARSLNNLATLYRDQGQYAKVEPLYLRALAIYVQQSELDYYGSATILHNLADLYQARGQYAKAEPLYLRALAISEQQLGPDHPDTATCLHNLAALCRTQGQYARAEPLYLRAHSIWERQLGPDHPSTAASLHNLALLYQDQGQDAKAEPLYLRALSIREQQLGPDHPSTATSLNNLALLYQAQGKYAQAEPLYRRALTILEGQFGTMHPDARYVQENYIALLRAIKQEEDEVGNGPFSKEVRLTHEQGIDSKKALTYMNWGLTLIQQGHYEEALTAFKQSIQLDPANASAYANTGATLLVLGHYEEALPAFEQAIRLDPTHSDAYNNKGTALQVLGYYEQALAAHEQAIRLNPTYADAHMNRGAVFRKLGRYKEALAAYEQCIRLNPADADAHYNKGVALQLLEHNKEALAAYERAIQLDPTHADAHHNKAVLLRQLGREM